MRTGTPILETDRLTLPPLAPADIDAFHRILTEPGVRRYLLDDEVVERAWVEAEVRSSRGRFERDGTGLWGIRERGDDRLVGFAGYRPFFDPPRLQLLYGLDPAVWGRGYATEAARAVTAHGFEALGLEAIEAATDAPNLASRAVLERLGMTLERRATEDGRETLFFVLEHTHDRRFE